MINGIARYGAVALMDALVPQEQTVRVGGESRRLFLRQETANPDVAQVKLSAAGELLRDVLGHLGSATERATKAAARRAAAAGPVWTLALDETEPSDVELRPRLPFNGPRDFTGPSVVSPRAAPMRAAVLSPIDLDALTVVDDQNYLDQMDAQPNVPEAIRSGLRQLY
jgi:5-methylthioadenosine/S-adenosylhomocysteine deaminase